MKRILGIDEAGRGPVIGPLVMCGYMIGEEHLNKLKAIGVKDSKMLSPQRREQLDSELRKHCTDFTLLSASAAEIDEFRGMSNLNKLEIEKMCQIINAMHPDIVYIDAIESNVKAFRKKISSRLDIETKIIAENYADKNYAIVGAASVLAKVSRDKEIGKLHKKYGFFGSGYTSDPETIHFLKSWIKSNKEFPPCVRSTWITAVLMKSEKEQKRLMDFGE